MAKEMVKCKYCHSKRHSHLSHRIICAYNPKEISIEGFDAIREHQVRKLGGQVKYYPDGSAPNAYLPPGYLEVWDEGMWLIVKEIRD